MTLDIVGGTYFEESREGEWEQLFGSGFRAAAALATSAEVTLHTCIDEASRPLAGVLAGTFGFRLLSTVCDKTALFQYDQGLSVPHIFPPVHKLAPGLSITTTSEKILRFGMIEADAIVEGGMVVYDPQSAYSPVLFDTNGSRAGRLSIVCNRREAALMSNLSDIPAAAEKLRSDQKAEVVVVKCGSHGAILASEDGITHVPAFRTSRVWPIGSGDVFAAAYFACWAGLGQSPYDAALAASKSTAHYCETRSLPLPTTCDHLPDYPALKLRQLTPTDRKPKVYLAGPFFNMGERWLVNQARDALLDQGLDVFSPFHDVGIGVAEDVVPADIKALREADIVLALLDHLDSGTVFEVGYAKCLDKPVVGFCQSTSNEALKMLVGTGCDVVDDFVSAIYLTAWTALRA